MRLALGTGLLAVVVAVVIVLVSGGRERKGVETPVPEKEQGGVPPLELEAAEVLAAEPTAAVTGETPTSTTERAALDVDELAGMAPLSGRVSERGGTPIAGARVRVSSFERREGKPRFRHEGTTDEAGGFQFELEVGAKASAGAGQQYLIHASHPDYETATLLTNPMRAGLGIARNLYLDPRKDVLVEVEVVVHDNVGPVLGANVLLFDEVTKGDHTYLVRVDSRVTDQEGRIVLGSQILGRKEILVAARSLGFQLYRAEHFVTRPGRTRHDVLLREGLAITGVVRSTAGDPLDGIKLRLNSNAELEAEQVLVASKAGGFFRVDGLEPGIHTLESLTGNTPWSPFRIDVVAGQEDLELVLKRPFDPVDHGLHLGEIHGTVMLPTGIEAPNPRGVWIQPASMVDSEAFERDVLPRLMRPRPVRSLREIPVIRGGKTQYRIAMGDDLVVQLADELVEFHFVGLEDGHYYIGATHPEASPALMGPLSIRNGALLSGVRLELLPNTTVSGRVVDPDGLPVAQAIVMAVGTRGNAGRVVASLRGSEELRASIDAEATGCAAYSDADGFFTIDSVPIDVPIVIEASHRGYYRTRSSVLRPAAGEAVSGLQLVLEKPER